MNTIQKHTHTLVVLVFALAFFFLSFLFTPTPSYADGPCDCNGSGVCDATCSPSLRGMPCGTNSNLCNRAQKRYSCENTITYNGTYYCPNTSATFVNAEKGSWSEVFQKCFCSIGDMVQQILNIAIYGISIIALILLGIGGIKYVTAQNNPDKITEAKEMLIAALSGMVLVLCSIAIIRILSGQFPGSWGINFLNLP